MKHLDLREVMGYEKTPVEFYPLPHHPLNVFDVETSSSASLLSDVITSRPSSAGADGNIADVQLISNGLVHGTDEHESTAFTDRKDAGPNGFNGHATMTSVDDKEKIKAMEINLESEEEVNQILEGHVPGGHFVVLMYYGNSENEHFIGPAPFEDMVQQIHESSGPSGSNKEYLFNLADAMRQICEEAIDPHLAELEMKVRKLDMSLNKKRSGRSTPIEL